MEAREPVTGVEVHATAVRQIVRGRFKPVCICSWSGLIHLNRESAENEADEHFRNRIFGDQEG